MCPGWSPVSLLAPRRSHGAQISLGPDRQAHAECGSGAVMVVGAHDFAFVLAHDAVTDAQPQAGPLPDFLGGEKRIENALGVLDAFAIVAELRFQPASLLRGFNLDQAAAPRGPNRIVSVVEDVEKDLLQLVRIADEL